jgi:hypothetical protein
MSFLFVVLCKSIGIDWKTLIFPPYCTFLGCLVGKIMRVNQAGALIKCNFDVLGIDLAHLGIESVSRQRSQ